jgi:hypothetical protein
LVFLAKAGATFSIFALQKAGSGVVGLLIVIGVFISLLQFPLIVLHRQVPGRFHRPFAIARTTARKYLNPFANPINARVRV